MFTCKDYACYDDITEIAQQYNSTYTEGNMQFDSSFWRILKRVNGFLPQGKKVDDLSKEDKDMIWNIAFLISHARCKNIEINESDDTISKMVKEIKKEAEREIREKLETELYALCFGLSTNTK